MLIRSCSLRVLVACVAVMMVSRALNAAQLPRVRIADTGRHFVTDDGRVFMPFGINYFRPGTGWAPQVWKQFDPEATRRDLLLLKGMGGNCVRVFLTAGSFYKEPGVLDAEGVAKLDRFLELAEEAGVYVHPTGPDHWEGSPPWFRTDRFSDEKALAALESFWKLLAARYRGRSVIFAYDLLNEPMIPWNSGPMRERWTAWVKQRHGSVPAAAGAWGIAPPADGNAPVPPTENALESKWLLEYQDFREHLADEWTRRQAEAIKSADPDALVTVGLIQWSVPVVLPRPSMYAAYRPQRQAKFLDFLEVHFYPLARGAYQYDGPEAEAHNLAYLEAVVREVALPGKPVVVAEYGWYGGGSFRMGDAQSKPASEQDQARWCTRLIETTRPLAAGWLNWGFYDHPESRDVSIHTGLLTPEGQEKAWGRAFRELARRQSTPTARPDSWDRPTLPWAKCITSSKAADEFRAAYHRAYLLGTPSGQ